MPQMCTNLSDLNLLYGAIWISQDLIPNELNESDKAK